jgi:hypothetical protein
MLNNPKQTQEKVPYRAPETSAAGAQTTPASSVTIFGFFKVPNSVVLALIVVIILHWVVHTVHGLFWGNEVAEILQAEEEKHRKVEVA